MYDGLFQSVEVPAGMSTVRFTYECPHGKWTVPMFWLGPWVLLRWARASLWRDATCPRIAPPKPTRRCPWGRNDPVPGGPPGDNYTSLFLTRDL